MAYIYLNGKFIEHGEASLDPLDRGVQLGDGIFETIRCEEGQLLFHVAHFSRLARSARIVRLPWAMPNEELLAICQQVIDANHLHEVARLRITVTRGESTGSPEIGSSRTAPTLIVNAAPVDQRSIDKKRQDGLKLFLADFPKNHRSPLASVKTTSYMENLMARQAARDAGADEALLLNLDGNIAEGAMSNIFIVKDNRVITPPVGDGALPGTIRLKVGIIAARLGLEYEEHSLRLADLRDADEVFLTSAITELTSATMLGADRLGGASREVTEQLYLAHRADVNDYLHTMRSG